MIHQKISQKDFNSMITHLENYSKSLRSHQMEKPNDVADRVDILIGHLVSEKEVYHNSYGSWGENGDGLWYFECGKCSRDQPRLKDEDNAYYGLRRHYLAAHE